MEGRGGEGKGKQTFPISLCGRRHLNCSVCDTVGSLEGAQCSGNPRLRDPGQMHVASISGQLSKICQGSNLSDRVDPGQCQLCLRDLMCVRTAGQSPQMRASGPACTYSADFSDLTTSAAIISGSVPGLSDQ